MVSGRNSETEPDTGVRHQGNQVGGGRGRLETRATSKTESAPDWLIIIRPVCSVSQILSQ